MLKIAKSCLWISIAIGVMGLVTSVHPPGADFWWYALAAAVALPGLIIPRWSFRGTAIALFVLWSWMAASGYTQGRDYHQWLKDQPVDPIFRQLDTPIDKDESDEATEATTPQDSSLQ